VNLRLIAATNRDLAKGMAQHEFRSDLFYRLTVFPIRVPPLRERPEDIPLLIRYFVRKFAARMAQCLSSVFQSAYRDIHDLALTRSSSGKLARFLLAHSPTQGVEAAETRTHSWMTHEEMAQRIGSSRETVTRLLSVLKKSS
jgi:transcriptional regulator of acetoin/glycerol metabolism